MEHMELFKELVLRMSSETNLTSVMLEEIARLREELLESENLRKGVEAGFDCANAELLRLREQLATAQKDAERYQWLRDEDSALERIHEAAICLPHGEELDEAIDNAMKENKHE